jgi:hypothetical protein
VLTNSAAPVFPSPKRLRKLQYLLPVIASIENRFQYLPLLAGDNFPVIGVIL